MRPIEILKVYALSVLVKISQSVGYIIYVEV